jgi:hypothetical protein
LTPPAQGNSFEESALKFNSDSSGAETGCYIELPAGFSLAFSALCSPSPLRALKI